MGFVEIMWQEITSQLHQAGYNELSEVLARASRQQLFKRFIELAGHVWSNDLSKFNFKLSDKEPAGKVLASIAFANVRGHKAIGDSIVYAPKEFTLFISDRLLDKDNKVIDGILIHEAVHMGYPNHDANFRKLVLQKGGALTERASESGNKFTVEVKDGARYKKVADFDSEKEANKWIEDQLEKYKKNKKFVVQLKDRGKFEDKGTFDTLTDARNYIKYNSPVASPGSKYRITIDAPQYRMKY